MNKLMSLTSRYQAEVLSRQVYISNRLKSENDEIYDVVDKIHSAVDRKSTRLNSSHIQQPSMPVSA